MKRPPRRQKVFINCPFDKNYKPIFDAIVFTLHHLGYVAEYALNKSSGDPNRLTRIYRQLRNCGSSIHDISRVNLSGKLRLPRFNMPFEAGLAYSIHASRIGGRHDLLVLDAMPHRFHASISDLGGLDPKNHYTDEMIVIAEVRTFFSQHNPGVNYDGAGYIKRRYLAFLKRLKDIAKDRERTIKELQKWDNAIDLQYVMAEWIRDN